MKHNILKILSGSIVSAFLFVGVQSAIAYINNPTVTGGSIGGVVSGGTSGSVLFVDGNSSLAQDNTNLFYNSTAKQLRVGLTGAPSEGDSRVRLDVVGNVNDYADAAVQNKNSGDSATGDFFTSADNDSSTLIGHYTDFGITSSGWNATTAGNIKTVSVNTAGTGYTIGDVLTVSTGGDGNGQVTVATINGGGGVTSVTLSNNGTGYVIGNAYLTTGGTGTGAKINVLSIVDFTLWSANDGYLYNSGGNLDISTDTSGKVIKFSVAGIGTTNQVAQINTTGLAVSGSVLSSSPSGGIGYSTGAGCAVTQGTNRTTGVTCTGDSGAITLISAAGSATPASFIVTDTSVAATDTIHVNEKSGTDLYEIFVTNVGAGSFKITSFTTGGTTTEQPVFNFSIIKAVAS